MVFACGVIFHALFIKEPTPYSEQDIETKCKIKVFDSVDDCREAFANINHKIRMRTDEEYRRRDAESTERLMQAARDEIQRRILARKQ